MRKKVLNEMIALRLSSKLLHEYKDFCNENSINMSKRIRKFMENELEAWREMKIAREERRNKL